MYCDDHVVDGEIDVARKNKSFYQELINNIYNCLVFLLRKIKPIPRPLTLLKVLTSLNILEPGGNIQRIYAAALLIWFFNE